MRSLKMFPVKVLSLAAVLMGAVGLAACGGGGAAPGGTTLLIDAPVLTPPPGNGNLPDPIPAPPVPPDGGGNPVEPPPVDPPVDPPADPVPPIDLPPVRPAPDLAHVSAMAVVGENAAVVDQAAADYVGLYVAEEDGGIWRQDQDGNWKEIGQVGVVGTVEAMTYVRTKHALYLAITSLNGRQVLARWLLQATPAVFDLSDPPVLLDPGGVQFQILENLAGDPELLGVGRVTALAFDIDQDLLFAWDQPNRALLSIADLDLAEATFETQINLVSGLLSDVEDMAYDRTNARMLLVDAAAATVVELDHLGLAYFAQVTLPFADLRALAWEEVGTRLAVDRATATLVRFEASGAVVQP